MKALAVKRNDYIEFLMLRGRSSVNVRDNHWHCGEKWWWSDYFELKWYVVEFKKKIKTMIRVSHTNCLKLQHKSKL